MNALGNGPIPFHFFNPTSLPSNADSVNPSSSSTSPTASSSTSSTTSSHPGGHGALSTPSLPSSSASLGGSSTLGLSGAGMSGHSGVAAPPRRVSPYQKPIRGTFKVSEGTFRLQREISLFKTPQRHPSRHFNPSKLVGIILRRSIFNKERDTGTTEDTEEEVLYFSVNSDAGLYCDKYCIRRPFQRFEGKDHTVRFNASAFATCHDFNRLTAAPSRIEIAIGFNTGQILVHDPFFKTISNQINFTMQLTTSKVTSVRWVPGSRSLFVTSHVNGQLMVFDKERTEEKQPIITEDRDTFIMLRQKTDLENPVSVWKICKNPINELAFSPDGEYLATVSQDGYLRVFHFRREKLLISFRSYFGGLISVAWSPDSKYLLTGGEDDLITVWSLRDRYPVCRGEGHRSWVSAVAFDKFKCDSTVYRFGSVGQDGQLLLWEFALDALPRPRSSSFGSLHRRASLQEPLAPNSTNTNVTSNESSSNQKSNKKETSVPPVLSGSTSNGPISFPSTVVEIPAPSRFDLPILEPVVSHRAHNEPITAIEFLETAVTSVCVGGLVKFWARPNCYVEEIPEPLDLKALQLTDKTSHQKKQLEDEINSFTPLAVDTNPKSDPMRPSSGLQWTLGKLSSSVCDQRGSRPSTAPPDPSTTNSTSTPSMLASSSSSLSSSQGGEHLFSSMMGRMKSYMLGPVAAQKPPDGS